MSVQAADNGSSRVRRIVGVTLKFIVPVVISVGLCWALFRNVRLSDMLEVVRNNCDFKWIAMMLAVSFMSYVFRALRWGLQLDGVGVKAPFRDLLYSIFGTYAVNLVFPRLGEVWRSGFIAHRERAPFGTVMGTMLADRFADLLTGILFVLASLVLCHDQIMRFFRQYPDGYRKIEQVVLSPWTWMAVAVAAVACVVFFRWRSDNRLVVRIKEFCRELWNGFAAILKIRRKGLWLLWTVMLWGCYFVQMILAFQAFPFTREIFAEHGTLSVLLCFTLGTVAMGLPTVNGFGPYQLAVMFGLSIYAPGLSTASSGAFANLVLIMSTCLTIAVGLWTFAAIAIGKGRPRNGA